MKKKKMKLLIKKKIIQRKAFSNKEHLTNQKYLFRIIQQLKQQKKKILIQIIIIKDYSKVISEIKKSQNFQKMN